MSAQEMSDIKNRSEEEYTELIAEAKFTQMRYEQWKRNFGDQCCSLFEICNSQIKIFD